MYNVGDIVETTLHGPVHVDTVENADPNPALARYRVRLATGDMRSVVGTAMVAVRPAPLMGNCVECGTVVEFCCYCPQCQVPRPSHVFAFDQTATVNTPELQRFSKGACLAIAMLWCKHRKLHGAVVTGTQYLPQLQDAALRQELAGWMDGVQTDVLMALFDPGHPPLNLVGNDFEESMAQHSAPFFERRDSDGQVITGSDSTLGQLAEYKAYAYRLEKMSQWASNHSLRVLDDRVGMPDGASPSKWLGDVTTFMGTNCGVYGLISLSGPDAGHAMGFMVQDFHGAEIYRFFDPNLGEFACPSMTVLSSLLQLIFRRKYSGYSDQWWVLKMA